MHSSSSLDGYMDVNMDVHTGVYTGVYMLPYALSDIHTGVHMVAGTSYGILMDTKRDFAKKTRRSSMDGLS